MKVGGGARGSGRMEVYKVTLEVKMREQVKQQNRLVHVCGRACVCEVLCPVIIHTLIPRPVEKGLATCNTCPKEIQSVTQSHVNVYTHMEITGGVRSYLHAAVLLCKSLFALLDHRAVSVLSLVCGDEARVESIEQYQWSNTMKSSHDRSSFCSQLLSALIQRRRLLLFCALATTFLNPCNIKSLQYATASLAHSRLS